MPRLAEVYPATNGAGPATRSPDADRVVVALSLVAKSLLARQIFAATLM
jgi:hypothetical protein